MTPRLHECTMGSRALKILEPRICSGVFHISVSVVSVLQDNGVVPGTVSQRSGPIYRRMRNVLEPLMAYSVCTDESCCIHRLAARVRFLYRLGRGSDTATRHSHRGTPRDAAGRRGTAGETRDAGISRGSRSTMKFKMRGQPRSLHHPAQKSLPEVSREKYRAASGRVVHMCSYVKRLTSVIG